MRLDALDAFDALRLGRGLRASEPTAEGAGWTVELPLHVRCVSAAAGTDVFSFAWAATLTAPLSSDPALQAMQPGCGSYAAHRTRTTAVSSLAQLSALGSVLRAQCGSRPAACCSQRGVRASACVGGGYVHWCRTRGDLGASRGVHGQFSGAPLITEALTQASQGP